MPRNRTHQTWDNKDKLKLAILDAKSLKEVLANLGIANNSGNYSSLKSAAARYELELPKFDSFKSTKEAIQSNKLLLEEIFSNRNRKFNGQTLRKLLVKHYNIEDKCSRCGQLPVWLDEELVLELDHIDGNQFNNCVDNLRILCGHCHSQTKNFRGRNKKSGNYKYCSCGNRIDKLSDKCRACSDNSRSKERVDSADIKYGGVENVIKLYNNLGSFSKVGRVFNVSDTSIRKYLTKRNVDLNQLKAERK